MKLMHRAAQLFTLALLHSIVLNKCSENYPGTTAIPHDAKEFAEDSRSLEFVEQNWVDCALSPRVERKECMKKLGLDMNGKKLKTAKGGGGKHVRKSPVADVAKGAASAAERAMKKLSAAPATRSQAAIYAMHDKEKASKLAAVDAASLARAKEKLKKARAAAEKQQKQPSPGEKWELWYKEKVHKVNLKLKSDKSAIKAKRNAQVKSAKAKARAAGAHVSDLGSIVQE